MQRADDEGVFDFPLKRWIMPYLLKLFPKEFEIYDFLWRRKCWINKVWESELTSEFRREIWGESFLPNPAGIVIPVLGAPETPKCLKIMKGVRICDREHYENVCLEFQAAVKTWDLWKHKAAITKICGPWHPRYVLKEDKREASVLP